MHVEAFLGSGSWSLGVLGLGFKACGLIGLVTWPAGIGSALRVFAFRTRGWGLC